MTMLRADTDAEVADGRMANIKGPCIVGKYGPERVTSTPDTLGGLPREGNTVLKSRLLDCKPEQVMSRKDYGPVPNDNQQTQGEMMRYHTRLPTTTSRRETTK
jgi:hypothetical protein